MEDASKLVYRAKLQESLARFAATLGELDFQVAAIAEAWGVGVQKGAITPDPLPALVAIPASPDPTDAAASINDASHDLSKIAGKWRVTYDNHESAVYQISADGAVKVVKASYRTAGATLKVEYTDGWFLMDIHSMGRKERFKLDGDKLVLQHWGVDGFTSPEKGLHAAGERIPE
jgi:hypothetical protein